MLKQLKDSLIKILHGATHYNVLHQTVEGSVIISEPFANYSDACKAYNSMAFPWYRELTFTIKNGETRTLKFTTLRFAHDA